MKQCVVMILVLLSLWSFRIGVVYRHVHTLSDGSVVEHSHPYDSQNSKEESPHSHTSVDFSLSNFLITDDTAQCSLSGIILFAVEFHHQVYHSTLIDHGVIGCCMGRAPPFDVTFSV